LSNTRLAVVPVCWTNATWSPLSEITGEVLAIAPVPVVYAHIVAGTTCVAVSHPPFATLSA
jgi:hypothetical protein